MRHPINEQTVRNILQRMEQNKWTNKQAVQNITNIPNVSSIIKNRTILANRFNISIAEYPFVFRKLIHKTYNNVMNEDIEESYMVLKEPSFLDILSLLFKRKSIYKLHIFYGKKIHTL